MIAKSIHRAICNTLVLSLASTKPLVKRYIPSNTTALVIETANAADRILLTGFSALQPGGLHPNKRAAIKPYKARLMIIKIITFTKDIFVLN